LRFNYGDKVGVLGANGAGKSTLIKLIMGKVKACLGTANLTNQVQIGYFSQHHIDDLDLNKTPLQQLEQEFGRANVTRQQLYAQLGRFNIAKEIAERKIGTLSGGQKSRVTFAILTWWQPHLIIMDEPTNHCMSVCLCLTLYFTI
jgi:ATP-binding cassette subfamily F protein 3